MSDVQKYINNDGKMTWLLDGNYRNVVVDEGNKFSLTLRSVETGKYYSKISAVVHQGAIKQIIAAVEAELAS